MGLKTAEQYEESLRKLNLKVYLLGELVSGPVDHPIIRPSMNSVKMTYALAHDPQHEDLMTATSHLSGQKINRFCHLHQSNDDLVKKVKMQRLLGQKTGSCFQRCVGMDAINAVDSVTFEMDEKLGTEYHKRFLKFLRMMQEEDLTVDGAMTDPKGDRSLAPSKQADPDMYVRVVEKKSDGIVVRGAKAHQTGAVNSHWILVMPTISMQKDDADYAVCFAAPADAEGIFYIYGRQSCDTRKLEGGDIDVGNKQFGGHEALMVFEDVFIPWENVFMCGEHEFSGATGGAIRRIPPAELRGLQGRCGRCSHRRGGSGCGLQRSGKGFAHQRQTHRNDPSERNTVCLRHSLFIRREKNSVRHVPHQPPPRERVQTKRHTASLRNRKTGRRHSRRTDGHDGVGA